MDKFQSFGKNFSYVAHLHAPASADLSDSNHLCHDIEG